MKHIFDLSNESNTCNGVDDIILMKKTDSSDRQQKVDKTKCLYNPPQKWSFLLRISSVNATKFAGVTFTVEIINWKLHFFVYSNKWNKYWQHYKRLQPHRRIQINIMKEYDKEKKGQNETEGRNDRKKERSIIILEDNIVMHISGWQIPIRFQVFAPHL